MGYAAVHKAINTRRHGRRILQVIYIGNLKLRRTQIFKGIRASENWQSVEKISKGWSEDSKYFVETKDKGALLLRVADIEHYDAKKILLF